MFARKTTFQVAGKELALYVSSDAAAPLVVLNSHAGGGEAVVRELEALGCAPCSLLAVGGLAWNRDLVPWDCPPMNAGGESFVGGAGDYLQVLTNEILPEARQRLNAEPVYVCLAGYSLAGLFALYALYRCDAFLRVASVSGSLWFPDFCAFAMREPLQRVPHKLYLSLGDREARTRNPLLRTVQDNTQTLAAFYERAGVDVTFELNAGNHFKRPDLRTAKGIAAILAE